MNILFVCSGNICRSPIAAALVRHKVASLIAATPGADIQVKSAGTSADPGQPMALAMELILQERGIDSTHQSQRLDWALLDWADLVLTMTQTQKILLRSQVPQIAAKLATLNEYSGNPLQPDIEDPRGCDLASYRQCANQIETACDHLLNKLQTAQQPFTHDLPTHPHRPIHS